MRARYSGAPPRARSLGVQSAGLRPRPGSRNCVSLQQQRFLAAYLAEQVDAARLIERGTQPRELDRLLLVRVRRDRLPQRTQILDPARIGLRPDLELEQLDLDLGVIAVKLQGLLAAMRVVAQHRIDNVLLRQRMRGEHALQLG